MGDPSVFDALLSGPDATAPGADPQTSLSFDVPATVGRLTPPSARFLPPGAPGAPMPGGAATPVGSPMFPQFQETPPVSSLLTPEAQPGQPGPSWKDTLVRSLIAGLGGFAAARAHISPAGVLDEAQSGVDQNDVQRYKIALANAQQLRLQQANLAAQQHAQAQGAATRLALANNLQTHLDTLSTPDAIKQYKDMVHDYYAPFGIDTDKFPSLPSVGALQKLQKTYQDLLKNTVEHLKTTGVDVTDPKLWDPTNPTAPTIEVQPGSGVGVKLGQLAQLATGAQYDPTKMPMAPKKSETTFDESSFIKQQMDDFAKAHQGRYPVGPDYGRIVLAARAQWADAAREKKPDASGALGAALDQPLKDTSTLPGGVNPDVLKGLSPVDQQTVKMLANYSYPLTGRGISDKLRPYIAIAQMYDSSFDPSQYTQRQAVMKDFAAGKTADNIQSLNTAVHHLMVMQQAAQQLNNYSFKPANSFKNWLLDEFDNPRPNNFNIAADAVTGELSKTFTGKAGTDPELSAWRQRINSAQGPRELADDVREGVKLMAGRLQSASDRWQAGMRKSRPFQILSPSSLQTLKQMGIDPSSVEADQTLPTATDYFKNLGVVSPQTANPGNPLVPGGPPAPPVAGMYPIGKPLILKNQQRVVVTGYARNPDGSWGYSTTPAPTP